MALVLIVLVAGLYFMIAATPPRATGWEYDSSGGHVQYLTVGPNDTLYAFKDNGIYAIDRNGGLLWHYPVPSEWQVLNSWERPVYAEGASGVSQTVKGYPVAEAANGTLYVFALPQLTLDGLKAQASQSRTPYVELNAAVLAISPRGQLEWQLPLTVNVSVNDIIGLTSIDNFKMTRNVAIRSAGDRVYVFHDYTETAVGLDGKVLFSIDNVAEPAAVDEQANLYLVQGMAPVNYGAIDPGQLPVTARDPGYLVPSSLVKAYDADGNLIWERQVQGTVAGQYVAESLWPQYNCLPMYQNGTLYLPMVDGIIAMDQMSHTLWWKWIPGGTYAMFELMPIDSQGNVYMKDLTPGSSSANIYAIGPDGWIHNSPWRYYNMYDDLRHTAASEGIVYNIDKASFTVRNINSLEADTITAYNISTGASLWSYTLPVRDRVTVVLNESNVGDVFKGPAKAYIVANALPSGSQHRALTPVGWPEIDIYPGAGITYVSFRSINYETPVVYGYSRAVYSSGIYALDSNGRLIWSKPLDALVTASTTNNSTMYYSTADGKIFGTKANVVVGGLAALAVLGIFFKFFVFGTVSRARDRLDKNDNRNQVLAYIAGTPGATAVDIARDMGLNVGTVRYHLLILTINHKIVEHKDDKYLRYFTNSNSYSMAGRAVISLMKREPMWRVLNVLAEKPGLSNVEISKELSISTGAASRHMNELLTKGIVIKMPQGDRGFAYSIKDEYRLYITRMMERL